MPRRRTQGQAKRQRQRGENCNKYGASSPSFQDIATGLFGEKKILRVLSNRSPARLDKLPCPKDLFFSSRSPPHPVVFRDAYCERLRCGCKISDGIYTPPKAAQKPWRIAILVPQPSRSFGTSRYCYIRYIGNRANNSGAIFNFWHAH